MINWIDIIREGDLNLQRLHKKVLIKLQNFWSNKLFTTFELMNLSIQKKMMNLMLAWFDSPIIFFKKIIIIVMSENFYGSARDLLSLSHSSSFNWLLYDCGDQLYPVFKLRWKRPGLISDLICTNCVKKGQAQCPIWGWKNIRGQSTKEEIRLSAEER